MPETIKTAKELIRVYRVKNIPVYVHGKPGVGKSDMFRQLADELKIGFIDIRAATKLPEDFSGIPVADLENQVARWLKASFWPDPVKHGKKGIIVFDELSDTSKAVQSALYQVILDRKIGEMVLAEGWWPCAAGNRREDRAAAQSLSTALANRFAHIDVTEDPGTFIEWGNMNKINPLILAFIKVRPGLLHSMEGADLRAFPSPRSWVRASLVCEEDSKLRMRLVAGCVGEGAAGEFEAYMKALDLPELDDVVKSPSKCPIPKQPASRWALAMMLAQYATRDNFAPIYTYAKRDAFGRDFCICTVLEATKRDISLLDTKTYAQFSADNADITI